jgi:hypothetical protein
MGHWQRPARPRANLLALSETLLCASVFLLDCRQPLCGCPRRPWFAASCIFVGGLFAEL